MNTEERTNTQAPAYSEFFYINTCVCVLLMMNICIIIYMHEPICTHLSAYTSAYAEDVVTKVARMRL